MEQILGEIVDLVCLFFEGEIFHHEQYLKLERRHLACPSSLNMKGTLIIAFLLFHK